MLQLVKPCAFFGQCSLYQITVFGAHALQLIESCVWLTEKSGDMFSPLLPPIPCLWPVVVDNCREWMGGHSDW